MVGSALGTAPRIRKADQRSRVYTGAAPVRACARGNARITVMAEFLIQIHKSAYGYDVSCPSLPGCHSQGETEKEAIENIRDAIRECLAALPALKRDEKVIMIDVAV